MIAMHAGKSFHPPLGDTVIRSEENYVIIRMFRYLNKRGNAVVNQIINLYSIFINKGL